MSNTIYEYEKINYKDFYILLEIANYDKDKINEFIWNRIKWKI